MLLVFNGMLKKKEVSWTGFLLVGYLNTGLVDEILVLMTCVMPEINGVIYIAMVSGYVLDGVCSNDSSSVGCKTQ